jgi:rubrerythrin
MTLVSLVARATSPIVWRVPGSAARKLAEFAEAERGSMVELLRAAALAPNVEVRALFVRHALDEARHAQMFARASAELRGKAGKRPFDPPRGEAEDLYEGLGETGFLAFVHRAEKKGRVQFEAYRDHFASRAEHKLSAMFEAILVDERRHERYSRELLLRVSGGERRARRALRRAAAREAWRTWRRAGRFVGERVYFIAMIVLFVALAPFALLVRVLRPARGGWRS